MEVWIFEGSWFDVTKPLHGRGIGPKFVLDNTTTIGIDNALKGKLTAVKVNRSTDNLLEVL